MTRLWLIRKKLVNLAITLEPEDFKGAKDIGSSTGNNYTRVEKPFNNLVALDVFHRNKTS